MSIPAAEILYLGRCSSASKKVCSKLHEHLTVLGTYSVFIHDQSETAWRLGPSVHCLRRPDTEVILLSDIEPSEAPDRRSADSEPSR